MSQAESAEPARRLSGMRVAAFAAKPLIMLALLLALPFALHSGGVLRWPSFLDRTDPIARREAQQLPRAVALLKASPADGVALAAEATPEGHWRFVNRAGETLTAGTPEEMQRVASILLPDAKPDARLTLYLTQDTLLERRAALKDLPKGIQLLFTARDAAFPVLGRSEVASEPLYIEVRPNVIVEAGAPEAVREVLWQLLRPIDRASVRVLALEPGGPPTLTSNPRKDPATGRAMIDVIDPASLGAAMGSVRGQTLVISGRAQSGVIYVKPSSGPERGLLIKDLFAAAADADINLLILEAASTPRQPGGRNWFWQRIEVKGLDKGLQRPRMADLLDAVGGGSGRFLATAQPSDTARTLLELRRAPQLPRGSAASRGLGEVLMDSVSDITGRVITTRVQANLRNADRQREIDRRILPLVPSSVQIGYGLLFVLGLLGLTKSRQWWARIWPPENAAEYAGMAGYTAARVIRAALFYLVFLPLAAVPAAPMALLQFLSRVVRGAPKPAG